MKVYIIGTSYPYEGANIYGIYSTREKAEAAAKVRGMTFVNDYDEDFIEEETIDKEIDNWYL